MIFVSVGAQMPFDRLIRNVDQWAGRRGRDDIFAQIGPSDYKPKHIKFKEFIDPLEFRQRVAECECLVAHAGMGCIITALELGKPILVFPRRGDLRETRNDHQIATAKYFSHQGRIVAAFDEMELFRKLDGLKSEPISSRISSTATGPLIAAIRAFLFENAGVDTIVARAQAGHLQAGTTYEA
jgi:UDP-N-acetylglucosamine transferase subunit ALG13